MDSNQNVTSADRLIGGGWFLPHRCDWGPEDPPNLSEWTCWQEDSSGSPSGENGGLEDS